MNELIDFLKAGYPIVLDPYLYSYSLNSSAGKVMSGTNMYSFVRESKNKSNYKLLNLANASHSSFKASIEESFDITKPRITLISPISSDDSPIESEELIIEFQLYPWQGMGQYYRYNAYLYVDRNADGIFEEKDRLNISSSDGSSWESIMLSLNSRTYRYDVSKLNGAYQWMLLVERTDNPSIRASVRGYVSHTKKETLNILHIMDNLDYYSLEDKSQHGHGSLIEEYAGNGKLDHYDLNFESMTVHDYENIFTEDEPYSPSDSDESNKLAKYHLLILDNPRDAIDNTYGALTNIKDEIEKDLGVIYTKGALGFARQKDYYNPENYSFIDQDIHGENYTYNYINRNSITNGYMMIYRDMIGEKSRDLRTDHAYITNYLTKTNEGTITRYPYQIGNAITIADNSYSNDALIDYDLTVSPKQSLVGWYSLSDTKSPVVRDTFPDLTGSSDTLYHGVYSSSPNDVKNNYYLFSRGTTFYSGINFTLTEQAGKSDEMMLFINTIYAARQATEGRKIKDVPLVFITKPETDEAFISSDDLVGDDYIVTFELKESLSNMSLDISFGSGEEALGPWASTVYEYSYGDLVSQINTSEGKVFERDKTYAILIPKGLLSQSPQTLKITASNLSGYSGSASVSIAFSQKPLVEFKDPKIAYADINYRGPDQDQDLTLLNSVDVEFTVSQGTSPCMLKLSSGGIDCDNEKYEIYLNDVAIMVDEYYPSNGETYVLKIDMSLMENYNSREFTLVATDESGQQGSDTIRLIRRGLFPLD